MGFFSFIGGLVGRAVEAVGDKIGDLTGWYGIGDAGRAIQDACSESISSESSYDSSTASVSTAERLSEVLADFSEKQLNHSEELEKRCIKIVEEYCDALIQFLEESSNIVKDASGLRRIRNSRTRIKKTISGGIKEPLAKRMSLDDAECLEILKMDAGNAKKNKMEKFCSKVIQEALSNLSSKVREALDDQTEGVETYFMDYAEAKEREVENIRKQYDAMLQEGTLEEENIEKGCLNPLLTRKAAELIEGIL